MQLAGHRRCAGCLPKWPFRLNTAQLMNWNFTLIIGQVIILHLFQYEFLQAHLKGTKRRAGSLQLKDIPSSWLSSAPTSTTPPRPRHDSRESKESRVSEAESWEFRSATEAPIARLESLDELDQTAQVNKRSKNIIFVHIHITNMVGKKLLDETYIQINLRGN